jgi:tetratricopeptide (TPR) repeat protein
MNRLLMAVFIPILAASCAFKTPGAGLGGDNTVDASKITESSPLNKTGERADYSAMDMLKMSPGMITFLEEEVPVVRSEREQLRLLALAVIESGDFELTYDDSTRTASETFERREGNCLSFTNMFIAMARQLGLNAIFQEVDVPPAWTLSGQSYIFSQHINVYVRLERGFHEVVDFNLYEIDMEHNTRLVSDERARAHYFNNIGAEMMLAGDSAQAFQNLRESLLSDRSFVPAWVNMGILHRREEYVDWSEAAYLEALELDPGNLMALSNLVNLYEENGMASLARQYQERVESHRLRNPYYRYHRANQSFVEGDYDSAIKDLKYAIRSRKNEHQFYYLLSLCYLMKGERAAAAEWMEKAEATARSNSEKERYYYKLEQLRKLGSG